MNSKRWPFGFQKVTFYSLKGRLLACNWRPFVKPLAVSDLS